MKKQRRKTVLAILIIVLLFPLQGLCTEEYAKQTGKSCTECHKEAMGGQELTKEGEAFKDDLRLTAKIKSWVCPW